MSFSEWVKEQTGDNEHSLAKRALKECETVDLVTVISREIVRLWRMDNHRVEQEWFTPLKAKMGKPASMSSELSSSPFAPGDGSRVTWGEATIDDHRQRVAMLKGQRSGLDRTIKRHEEAIVALEKSGARCLNDLLAKAEVPA